MKLKPIGLALVALTAVAYLAFGQGALVETTTFYPIGQQVAMPFSGSIQYSDSARTLDKNTPAYLYLNITPAAYDRYRQAFPVLSMQVNMVVQTRAVDTSGANPYIRWVLDGKDTTRSTWVQLGDTVRQPLVADTLSFVNSSIKGYVSTDSIGYIPFQLRVAVLSGDSAKAAVIRMVDSTYITATYNTVP